MGGQSNLSSLPEVLQTALPIETENMSDKGLKFKGYLQLITNYVFWQNL